MGSVTDQITENEQLQVISSATDEVTENEQQ